jgi:phosphoenolpyruvate carboxykinase (GTP)
MLPFCGYNMADYWAHWLRVGQELRFDRAPRIFQVNWFRKDADGSFLWPGFGENSRVIEWIVRRIEGQVPAQETPAGRIPVLSDLNREGIDVSDEALEALFAVDPESWLAEADLTEEFFDTFGTKLPPAMRAELASLRYRLRH